MLVATLEAVCRDCIKLGLVRSKADFARGLLRRYPRYMALCAHRGGWVPYRVGEGLVGRLEAIRDYSPPMVRQDVQVIIDEARRGIETAQMFRR